MSELLKSPEVQGARTYSRTRVDYDDQALVSRMQRGDAEAFSHFYKRYEYRLLRTALRITKNYEDAQDAVQDAFLNAFRKLDTYTGAASFSTWLTRIVINCCLIQLRKRSSRSTVSLDDCLEGGDAWIELIPDNSFDVEEHIAQQQYSQHLAHAVAKLRPTLRLTVEVYLAEDRSMPELAAELGVTTASVKSRLHHARRQLRNSSTMVRAMPFGR